MNLAGMFVVIAVLALLFAGYFFFSTDRIANRNVLDRRVELWPARRTRKSGRPDRLEELINRVFIIDERLVRMKAGMAIVLLVAGLFLLLVSYALIAR